MAKVKNIKRTETKVELGGREREIRFDMNAFAELENRFGSIEAAMDALSSGQIGKIRMVLWAALIHDEVASFDETTGEPLKYNITPYEVGSWVHSPAMLTDVAKVVGQAMGANMPDIKDLPADVQAKLKAAGVTEETMKAEQTAEQAQEVKND
jgi:hypothetical protein